MNITCKLILLTVTAFLIFSFCACSDSSDVEVPEGCRIASSEALDCYFAYPAAMWRPGETAGYISVMKANNAEDGSSFVVNRWEIDGIIGSKDYWEGINNEPVDTDKATVSDPDSGYGGYEYMLSELVEGYKVISAREKTVDGHDAYEVVYEGKIASLDYRIMQITVARISGAKTVIYELTYTSTPEFFEQNLPDVETMIAECKIK